MRYSDGSAANDSTFIFEQLDLQYQDRPIIPRDPVKGFLTLLLEDMFDEWGTKVMFGMRWQKEVDQEVVAVGLDCRLVGDGDRRLHLYGHQ